MDYHFLGIDHVQLAAPEDCEKEAREFFTDLLGWMEIPKPNSLKKRGGIWFQCGKHQVHIGIQENFTPAKKAHPAFFVQNLDHLRNYLDKKNIPIIDDELRVEEGIKRFYIYDPFGNRLEFLEQILTN